MVDQHDRIGNNEAILDILNIVRGWANSIQDVRLGDITSAGASIFTFVNRAGGCDIHVNRELFTVFPRIWEISSLKFGIQDLKLAEPRMKGFT
jgi:hypothetical protein